MHNRKSKITISVLSILILIFSCIKRTDGLKPTDISPLIAKFLKYHVQYHNLNDEISKRTYYNLINYIDPGKHYFYKKDIENFSAYESRIDNLIENENFKIIFDIFAVYKKRFEENMLLFDDLLKLNYDFNKDETIIIDSDKIDYAGSKEEMTERWRKNIKLQLLNYLPLVKNTDAAKEKLKNRYRLTKKRISEIDHDRMIAIFLNSFSTALDPHSNYLSQEEYDDFMISTKLKLEGIGVMLRSEDGFVFVESIVPGGAAAKLPAQLQLKPNDNIIAVAQGDDEAVDVSDMDLRDVVKLIRGKSGKIVKLTILRKTDESKKQTRLIIPIAREEIKLEDRAAKSDIFIMKHGNKEMKIGFIKLPSFYLDFDAIQRNEPGAKSSSTDVVRQINKLKNLNIDGLIVDLRGNPGGALEEAVNVAGLFIDQGPIVEIRDGGNNTEVKNDEDPGVYYDGPLVVLIDKFSASASEIFAGAIKDYKRGIIIGPCNTFGKGSVQTIMPLMPMSAKQGAIKVTIALFYLPGGTSNQLYGVAPDINVPDISSIWDIGENKMKHPLKWEKMKSSNYVPYRNYIKPDVFQILQQKSKARISGNKEYIELNEKINSIKKKLNTKEISLKEESTIEKHKIKDMEKQLKRENDNKIIDIENDLFLREAFNVSADYIELVK